MPIAALVADAPEDVGVDALLLRRVFDRAAQEVESGRLDACQVAVCREGRLAGMATFGSCPDGSPATDSTLFIVSSCTKLVVSFAIWQLIDEGRLSLADRVSGPSFRSSERVGRGT